jgi:hypothetical protein
MEAFVILGFQSNSLTTVQKLETNLWRVVSRTDDDLYSAELVLDIGTPALDIKDAQFSVKRDVLGLASDFSPVFEKLVGVRVGSGMTKIVRAIVADEGGSGRAADLVLEAMEMLINALTVPQLRKATEDYGKQVFLESDGPRVFLNNVLLGEEQVRLMAGNPRMKDSCAAFRDL